MDQHTNINKFGGLKTTKISQFIMVRRHLGLSWSPSGPFPSSSFTYHANSRAMIRAKKKKRKKKKSLQRY